MSDIGMVMTMMVVARQRPRKMNTTSATKSMAKAMVSRRVSMVFMMLSEVLTMMPNFTSEGRFACNVGNMPITLLEISTELAPLCF